MRVIPEDFDREALAAIDGRLDAIEVGQRVRVPWAIESGSRAWGFPSPDSDYDCRFFFVRSPESYLSLWPVRDVIETPLDAVLDVNGWDLAKALRLAVAGNATVGEWLRSPIVYRGDPQFRDELLQAVDALVEPASLRRHYLHVGRDQWARAGDGVQVALKKVFYAVRPALSLRWLENHHGTPPMDLDALLAQTEVPAPVRVELAALREAKARTRELGRAALPAALGSWVEEVFGQVQDVVNPPDVERRAEADREFMRLLERWAPAV